MHLPEKWKHLASPDFKVGGSSDRRVGFIDLAPTLLSLAGQKPPSHSFRGTLFLGKHRAPPQEYGYGFRGRMDERYDMVRSVVGKRYAYVRNYMPHKLYGQHVGYMFTTTTQVWKRLFDEGKLNEAQSHFWKTKPPEELYDLDNDPDEVNNLAKSKDHAEVLKKMWLAHANHLKNIIGVGFLPEGEIHERSEGTTP